MNLTEGAIEGIPLIVVEGDLDQSSKQRLKNTVNFITILPL